MAPLHTNVKVTFRQIALVHTARLSQVGIKNPEGVAIPSVRNDAAFLYTLVGVTSGASTFGACMAASCVVSSCGVCKADAMAVLLQFWRCSEANCLEIG